MSPPQRAAAPADPRVQLPDESPDLRLQHQVEGGHTIDRFEIDWEREQARCPQGQVSSAWSRQTDHAGMPYISVRFRKADCAACLARRSCTRAQHPARHLKPQPRPAYEALKAARERLTR